MKRIFLKIKNYFITQKSQPIIFDNSKNQIELVKDCICVFFHSELFTSKDIHFTLQVNGVDIALKQVHRCMSKLRISGYVLRYYSANNPIYALNR